MIHTKVYVTKELFRALIRAKRPFQDEEGGTQSVSRDSSEDLEQYVCPHELSPEEG